MARLCISNKQVNRLVRTFLWRRVAESALHGTSFGNIPEEINRDYIADLHRISEAFAAPLANLFAFTKQGHNLCSFIPQKQLALHANPLFWQYGLFAFVSRCCSHNNQYRRKLQAQQRQPCPSRRSLAKRMWMHSPLCGLSSCRLCEEWSMETKRCPSTIFLFTSRFSQFQPSSQPWSSNASRRWE